MPRGELDDIDRALLRLLQADATLTLDELGAAVGLSGPAVQRRIGRHKKSGLIVGTTSKLDPTKVGTFITVLTLVTLERDSGDAVDALRDRIRNHESVQQCYELAGHFDLALMIVVPDMAAYRGVTAELLDADRNVRRFASHVALDIIKATLAVPLGGGA